jgi:hypothetical protein
MNILHEGNCCIYCEGKGTIRMPEGTIHFGSAPPMRLEEVTRFCLCAAGRKAMLTLEAVRKQAAKLNNKGMKRKPNNRRKYVCGRRIRRD